MRHGIECSSMRKFRWSIARAPAWRDVVACVGVGVERLGANVGARQRGPARVLQLGLSQRHTNRSRASMWVPPLRTSTGVVTGTLPKGTLAGRAGEQPQPYCTGNSVCRQCAVGDHQ